MSSKQIALVSLILLCLSGASPAAVPDPDAGWWKFDESTGGTYAAQFLGKINQHLENPASLEG